MKSGQRGGDEVKGRRARSTLLFPSPPPSLTRSVRSNVEKNAGERHSANEGQTKAGS